MVRSVHYLHTFRAPLGPILHRDIKSLNFLLDERLRIKVADFGLSKLQHSLGASHASQHAANLAGTLQWMAPELLGEYGQHTDKSDVFSLGVVMWELATGRAPWEGRSPNAIAGALLGGLRLTIPTDVPKHFAAWITCCWQEEPSLRPSCAELLTMMEGHMAEDPLLGGSARMEPHTQATSPAVLSGSVPAPAPPTAYASSAEAFPSHAAVSGSQYSTERSPNNSMDDQPLHSATAGRSAFAAVALTEQDSADRGEEEAVRGGLAASHPQPKPLQTARPHGAPATKNGRSPASPPGPRAAGVAADESSASIERVEQVDATSYFASLAQVHASSPSADLFSSPSSRRPQLAIAGVDRSGHFDARLSPRSSEAESRPSIPSSALLPASASPHPSKQAASSALGQLPVKVDVGGHLDPIVFAGVTADVWAGRGSTLALGKQFVWWDPLPEAPSSGSRALGVLCWNDPHQEEGRVKAMARTRVQDRQLFLKDVSDVFVRDLSVCRNSPFFAADGSPLPSVARHLHRCLSLRTERSAVHLRFDSASVRDEWVQSFLIILRECRYITEAQPSPSSGASSNGGGTVRSAVTSPSGLRALFTPTSLLSSQAAPIQYVVSQGSDLPVPSALLHPSSVCCSFSYSSAWGGVRVLVAPEGSATRWWLLAQDFTRREDIRGLPASMGGLQVLAMSWHDKSASLYLVLRSQASLRVARVEVREDRVCAVLGVAAVDVPGHPFEPGGAVHCVCSSDGQCAYVNVGSALLRVSLPERGDAAVVQALPPPPLTASGAVRLSSLTLSAFGQFVFCVDAEDARGSALLWNVHGRRWSRLLLRFIERPISAAFIAGTSHLLVIGAEGAAQLMDVGRVMKEAAAQHAATHDMQLVQHCLMGRWSLSLERDESGQSDFQSHASPLMVLQHETAAVVSLLVLPQPERKFLQRWLLSRSGSGALSP